MPPGRTSSRVPYGDEAVKTALAVMAGGALGSILRYAVSLSIAERWGTFPWGTLVVNVTGSFGIGFFAALTSVDGFVLVPPAVRIFVMVGIFGGFTTFSSFSLQTLNLVQDGEWLAAGGNIVFSVVLCLVAVWLGHVAATSFNNLTLR